MKDQLSNKTIAKVAEAMSRKGMTKEKAAEKLGVSVHTVKKAMTEFRRKPENELTLKSKI